MPPKGARVRCWTSDISHACDCAWLFCLTTMDTNRHEAVAGDANAPRTGDPGLNGSTGTAANGSGYNFPNSKRIYVGAELHRDVRVPFREISLAPTKSMNGETEANEPVRVYDTSGPWGDPSVTLDPLKGLPPLRRDWILKRGDVDEIEGRVVRPIDDGYLSDKHAAVAVKRPTFNGAGAPSRRKPSSRIRRSSRDAALVCAPGNRHARDGIHRDSGKSWPREFVFCSQRWHRASTPLIRRHTASGYNRNDLRQQHPGELIRSNHPRRNNT